MQYSVCIIEKAQEAMQNPILTESFCEKSWNLLEMLLMLHKFFTKMR